MKYLFIAFTVIFLSGCSTATKVKEYGGGVSNIRHPVAFALGATLYNVGKAFEDKPQDIDTKEQTYDKEDLEVKF